MPNPRRIILKNHLSPGDVLVMTAAIYSLHRAHPGKFVVGVDTSAPALWENSPDVIDGLQADEKIDMHYPLVNECNQRAVHFMQGYCDFLGTSLGVPVPLLTNRPHVWLSAAEKGWLNQVAEQAGYRGRFWLICSGTKQDYTAKGYSRENYQRVVDLLRGRVTFVQVGASEHLHPPLRGVINLVGRTDMRQLIRLCYHADGVLCGVTFLHHLAAALEKPSFVIMGGREPVQWNSYPKCQLFHTVGTLPCCRSGGCWKSRVVKLNDDSAQNSSLCECPVPGDEPIPRCMALISPDEVAAKIRLTAEHLLA